MKYIILSVAIVILGLVQIQNQSFQQSTGPSLIRPSEMIFNQDQGLRETRVEGEYMKAFLVAYEDLKSDPPIPTQTKALENYDLFFTQEGKYYNVLFLVKSKSSKANIKGGGTELGRDIEYHIDKESFQIIKKSLYK
jgi:hypothetical protein